MKLLTFSYVSVAAAVLTFSAVSCGKKNSNSSKSVKQEQGKNGKNSEDSSQKLGNETTTTTPEVPAVQTPEEKKGEEAKTGEQPVAPTLTEEVKTAFQNNCAGCHTAQGENILEELKKPTNPDGTSKTRGLNWAKEAAFRIRLEKTDRDTGALAMPLCFTDVCAGYSVNPELVSLLNWLENGAELK
jgi:mono/diheme cytochrome c family protein